MTAAALLAYAVAFVAGPLLYVAILKLAAVNTVPAALTVAVVTSMALAVSLRESVPLLALACLWLSWVLAVALMILALRRRALSPRLKRVSFVAGLLGTTLPWFGLATAQMVTF